MKLTGLLFHCLFVIVGIYTPLYAQIQTKYAAYNEDSDGDGVPNVRDKCPDTDKNLNGHEFPATIEGKQIYVKITDLKKGFENRRRRLLLEKSRKDKEKKAILDGVKGRADKLSPEDKSKVADLDSSISKYQKLLVDLVYEANVTINGKSQIVELYVGVDEFGCLPDRDGDNVPDIVDKCPDLPGIKPLFGCNDRDGDTVLDHEDQCIDEPGLVRLKGCPDKGTGDRDKDGTMDKDDLCIDVPGPKSNKGCPELVTEQDKKIIDQASKVLFATAKADLRPESLDILDKLANLIFDISKKHGKLNIRLEGHTDSDGTNEDNLELSRNRARSVKDYLVSKGIDIAWISTSGYGEERLKVSPERTPAHKQENRRVEIAITNRLQ